jgi:hypothetical protein
MATFWDFLIHDPATQPSRWTLLAVVFSWGFTIGSWAMGFSRSSWAAWVTMLLNAAIIGGTAWGLVRVRRTWKVWDAEIRLGK